MKYHVEFQIKEPDAKRPTDSIQDEELVSESPQWIPAPGDSIGLLYGGAEKAFIVLTRHFHLDVKHDIYNVNIVMRTAMTDEIASRIKM